MGYVAVDKIFDGRTFSADDRGIRTYRQVWRVQVDNQAMGPLLIAAAPGLPRRYRMYEDGAGVVDEMALAMSIDAHPQEEENPFIWLVNVDYSTKIWEEILRSLASGGRGAATNPHDSGGDNQTSNDPLDPVNKPWTLRWGTQKVMRPIRWDYRNVGVVNGANDLFDPLPEVPERIGVFTVSRNVRVYDASLIDTLRDTVNADIFRGYDPGFVLLDDATAESEFENGYYFWKENYQFLICPSKYNTDGRFDPTKTYTDPDDATLPSLAVYIKRNGWNFRDGRLLNAGWNQIVAAKKVPITAGDGQRYTKPSLLDKNGVKLADTATPQFLQFIFYPYAPFADLDL